MYAGVVQVERGEVGAVVGGEHDRLLADLDAVAVQEGAGAVGEHDAGTVVVGEHDGTFVRPGRDDDVAGPDAPDPLAAERRRGLATEMVGASLQRKDEPVVVVAEGGGALQVQHVGIGGQLGDRVGDPVQGGRAVDGVGAAEQRAAGLALLVDEHHPRAGTGRGQCGGQTGRPGTDDQQVGVHMFGVVFGGVGDLGEPALPGDTAGDQPVEQLDGRRQQHRLGEGLLDLDQAAGVLGPRRGEAAGPTQLDAGGDLVHAVGQQRRGQGVTGVPGQFPVVEGEGVRDGAVDATAAGGAEWCVHRSPASARPCGTRCGIGRWRCHERR